MELPQCPLCNDFFCKSEHEERPREGAGGNPYREPAIVPSCYGLQTQPPIIPPEIREGPPISLSLSKWKYLGLLNDSPGIEKQYLIHYCHLEFSYLNQEQNFPSSNQDQKKDVHTYRVGFNPFTCIINRIVDFHR